MTAPREAVLNVDSVDNLRTERGPLLVHYRRPLDRASSFYKWVVGSTATDDGRAVIVPSEFGAGGLGGAWVRQVEDDKGTSLTDASASLTVGGGAWRVLPAATLTANRTLTLSTTNAQAGDRITVTRNDATAYTVALVNGGAGAGTLLTFPASTVASATAQFDGANWALRDVGLSSGGSTGVGSLVRLTTASSATVLAAGELALVDVFGGPPPTITTTAAPGDGQTNAVKNGGGSFATEPCTVTANSGQTIEDPNAPNTYGATATLTTDGAAVEWFYDLAQTRWSLR